MNTTTSRLGLIGLAVLFAGACAKPQASPDLRDARSAYQSAATSPGATRAQADVAEAKRALDRAERAFAEDDESEETKDLAYVASRKAGSARAKASALTITDENRTAQAELKVLRAQQVRALEAAKGRAAMAQAELGSERQARIAAEARTRDALSKIEGMSAAQSERGLVLTLSGSVLFQTGKSVLLPAAQKRLDEAAAAIKEDGRPITVIGHTDSTGSDAVNEALSKKRAEAVATYLSSRGVPSDRVKTEGAGESQPIADNATPEGRANNRRVEVILETSRR